MTLYEAIKGYIDELEDRTGGYYGLIDPTDEDIAKEDGKREAFQNVIFELTSILESHQHDCRISFLKAQETMANYQKECDLDGPV